MVKTKPNGYFSNMTNMELFQYVLDNCYGLTLTLFKLNYNGIYEVANQRKIISELVSRGVLRTGRKPNKFYSSMSKQDLEDYIRENHLNRSIWEFQCRDSSAFKRGKELGIINNLIGSILVRKRSFLSSDLIERVIFSLQKSSDTYVNIASLVRLADTTVMKIARNAIKEDKLDPEYRRPNGSLYLANVRRESCQRLEEILS